MQIKGPETRNRFLDRLASILPKDNTGAFRLLAAISVLGLVFLMGAQTQKTGIFGAVIKPILKNTSTLNNYISSLSSKVERLTIDIGFEDYQRLAYQRHQGLSNKIMKPEYQTEVPADVRFKDRVYKSRIRLKGDMFDHWQDENKWSFRISLKGEAAIFGMKTFSVQHPKTRNYIFEWIYHQALKREQLIGLRYKFVDITLNGEDLGLYALEEHFEKRLIESNNRREGPILRFSENMFWSDYWDWQRNETLENYFTEQYLNSSVDAFQTSNIVEDSTSFDQFKTALTLLSQFRNGELDACEVFDCDQLATYLALSDLFGAEHSTIWNNRRFYYNPISSKLEPVGFDADGGERITTILLNENPDMSKFIRSNLHKETIFRDRTLLEQYLSELEKVSSKAYLDDLLNSLDDSLQIILNQIYSGMPFYNYDPSNLYLNQEVIRKTLNPTKPIHAHLVNREAGGITVSVANLQSIPVQISQLILNDSTILELEQPVDISPKRVRRPVEFHDITFESSELENIPDSLLKHSSVTYKLLATNNIRSESVIPWRPEYLEIKDDNIFLMKPNSEAFDFVVHSKENNEIYLKPGRHIINKTIIFPKHQRVIADAGTVIDMLDHAMFISFSPLYFSGSKEHPILFQSTDSTSKGMAVFAHRDHSFLSNVTFNNLGFPSQGMWSLSGAVNFYESPVAFERCNFIGSRSEDALNIIRTEYEIRNCIFKGNFSDAFDGDFTTGIIANSFFEGSGNDAIDVSGSYIQINDVKVDNSGDKGISIGENSRAEVNGLNVTDSEIAVACKDNSSMTISRLSVLDCKVSFTLFQKKPEFGPATIIVNNLTETNVEHRSLTEKNSQLVIDGQTIAPNEDKVKDLLYGVKFGKSSK